MRKKTDPRLSDTRRIKSCGNVFVDLGFDPAEAKVMALRAEVMIRMEQHLKAHGWTQAEAAKPWGSRNRECRDSSRASGKTSAWICCSRWLLVPG